MNSFRISGVESLLALSGNDGLKNYLEIPATATSYFKGPQDTIKIKNASSISPNGASYCLSYTFPDGVTKGYLPSSGDLHLTHLNMTEINLCFQTIGWTQINVVHPTHLYFSSTLATTTSVWGLESANSDIGYTWAQYTRSDVYYSRPYGVYP